MFPQVYTAEFLMSFLALAIFGVSIAEYFGVKIKKSTPTSLHGVFVILILISLSLAAYVFSGIFDMYEGAPRFGAYFLVFAGIHYISATLRGTSAAFSRLEIVFILAIMLGSLGSDFVFTYLQKNMLTATLHAILAASVVFAVYFFILQCVIRISKIDTSFVAHKIPIYYYPIALIFVLGSTTTTATLHASIMEKSSPARSLDEITLLTTGGNSISLEHAGMLLADELGMYEKRGLHVSFETYDPTLLIDGTLNGYGPFAIITDVALLRARQEGKEVIAVASLFQHSSKTETNVPSRNVLITRQDTVEAYPTIPRLFIAGTLEGWNWLFDNEETGLHLLTERLYPGAGYNLRSKAREELERIISLSTPEKSTSFGCPDRSAWSHTATELQFGDPSTAYTFKFLTCP